MKISYRWDSSVANIIFSRDTTVTSQKHSHGHVHHHHNRMGDIHTALQPPSTTHHHPPQVSLETHQTEKGGPNTTIAATTHHLHECEVRPQHSKCLCTSHCYISRKTIVAYHSLQYFLHAVLSTVVQNLLSCCNPMTSKMVDWGNPMTCRILDWKIHNASRELK